MAVFITLTLIGKNFPIRVSRDHITTYVTFPNKTTHVGIVGAQEDIKVVETTEQIDSLIRNTT